MRHNGKPDGTTGHSEEACGLGTGHAVVSLRTASGASRGNVAGGSYEGSLPGMHTRTATTVRPPLDNTGLRSPI